MIKDRTFGNRLKQFDAYPKTIEDFRVRTSSGATISILAGFFIIFLFISEFAYYLTTEIHPELSVDTSRADQVQINIDVIFPRLPCAYVSVDAMDVAGESQIDVEHNVRKRRLKRDGSPVEEEPEKENSLGKAKTKVKTANGAKCGSCYGAEQQPDQCCNTCEEVREAYRIKGWAFSTADTIEQCQREHFTEKLRAQANEGCHIFGYLMVSKTAGNFHFAPGKSFASNFQHVHDTKMFGTDDFDLSHKINSISFGQPFPGNVNPLDAIEKGAPKGAGSSIYQYFIKVVPTSYVDLSGTAIATNQFSVTDHFRALPPVDHTKPGHEHGMPGVFFVYDMSPIKVTYTERRKSFTHFLTGVCAIVGGVFTVAGLFDSLVYHGLRTFEKKVELGKAS